MRRLFKWAIRIVVLVVVAIVLLLVFKDSILRLMAEHQIRAATGMDVKIGRLSTGLFSPVITIENLKLYNTPEFGGTEFLVIPELHMEMDAQALASQHLRIKLIRLNLSELDVVKNQAGATNVVTMLAKIPKGKLAPKGIDAGFKKFAFDGIDVLNLSLGRMRFLDLKYPEKNRDVPLNLSDQVFNNVKTDGDLDGIIFILWMRSGGASVIRPNDLFNDFTKRKPHKAGE